MCELLIAARPIGSYERGEIVFVAPNGHPWTVNEGLPNYVVVQVVDATVDQARSRLQRLRRAAIPGVDPEAEAPDEPDRYVEVRPVNVWILWDDLPNNVKNALRNNGRYETDIAQIRNFLRRRRWDQAQLGLVDDGSALD